MAVVRKVVLAGCLTVAAAAATGVGEAVADTNPAAQCRASALTVWAPPAAMIEPVVANSPSSPCTDATQQTASVSPLPASAGALGLPFPSILSVTAPTAITRSQPGVVAASAGIAGASLNLAGVSVTVGAISSEQVRTCDDGQTVASGSSTVDDLVIGGTPVPLIAGQSIDQQIGPVEVRTNYDDGVNRNALMLAVTGLPLIVLGNASAGGDACAAVQTGSGSGAGGSGGGYVDPFAGGGSASGGGGGGSSAASRSACPQGSTYDVRSGNCVIRDGASSIVVGRPYDGPAGGSVISLARARSMVKAKKLSDSACLRGKGSKYVVLGTRKDDEITGTKHGDRILGLAGPDAVDGGGGADCIDGAAGHDKLTGDSGADRIAGGTAADNIDGGSGLDIIDAGSGNDTVNTGYGADHVKGGAGNDAINAATAGPAAHVDAGSGRDIVRINPNERRLVKHAEVIHVVRRESTEARKKKGR